MKFTARRRLHVEGLETRTMLAGDILSAGESLAATPAILGDVNGDGEFDQSDLVEVFRAGKYETGAPAELNEGDWNGDDRFDAADVVLAFQWGHYGRSDAAKTSAGNNQQGNWPDKIVLPAGFESEGIELGRGHEFFLGGANWSGAMTYTGAIYKGNLRTGAGEILVQPTGRVLAGLSYDARTDYLYAVAKDPGGFAGPYTNQGLNVYDASTGELVEEIIIGDGIVTNDVLVTNKAVYVTDSVNRTLYKIPLEEGGRPNSAGLEQIEMSDDFVMADGQFNANGLVGDFDGKELVVVNITTGVLYRVDTATGVADPIDIQGEEQLFVDGDGLYMNGRTLYIMQNFSNKIAVVQLSGDLNGGHVR